MTSAAEPSLRFPYRGHMPALDGLRGIAIVVVMAFHYYLFDHHVAPLHWLFLGTRSGWLGVDLFFVLSGFLITGILLDQRASMAPGGEGALFKTFYVRRTLRIFPLYYATLALVCSPSRRSSLVIRASIASRASSSGSGSTP